jgi:hypothetical protein
MKPIWLLETGVWKDDNVTRMIRIIQDLGLTVHVVPYTPQASAEFDAIDDDGPIIFYGSINTSEYLRVRHRDWVPFIWMDQNAFRCTTYYAHWGKYLLQEHYGFYPFAELPRLKDRLYADFGRDDMVFIRPDDNDKSFSARLVPRDNFEQWREEVRLINAGPASLVVVAAPVTIDAECRFVIADHKAVAGTFYKGGGKATPFAGDLSGAARLAAQVAADPWQPRPVYTLDMGFTRAGECRVVEINGINSSGLYRCDLASVIQAMSAVAVRDWRRWKGLA